MSWLSSNLGSIAKFALPVVGGVLGGPLGGAAGGAIGGLLSHGGVSGVLGGAAAGGAGGYAMQHSGISGGAMSEDPTGTGSGGGGGLGGLLSGAGNWIKNNPTLALAGGTAALGALQSHQAGGYAQQGLDLAKQQYGDAAPFRADALASLAKAHQAPNLGWMTQGSNPYLPKVGGQMAAAPAMPPSATPGAMPQGGAGTILPRVGGAMGGRVYA